MPPPPPEKVARAFLKNCRMLTSLEPFVQERFIMDIRAENLAGQRFGKLTAMNYVRHPEKGAHWLCVCGCGEKTVVRASQLKSGHTQSCGCLHRERVVTHNDSNSSEYRTWDAMKRRCYNPATKHFEHYGGRGITVCDSWRDSYENFLSDMGRRPSRRYSLDRIDNDGNYEVSNCRWTIPKIQIRNRSNARHYDFDGRQYSAMELSERFGVPFNTLRSRLNRGWTVARAVSS